MEPACSRCPFTGGCSAGDDGRRYCPHRTSAALLLADFHAGLGEPFGCGDRDPTLRIRLHRSEMRELVQALRAHDRVGIAHELADNVIVAYGTAHSLGIPLDAVVAEVMAANMRKLGPDGPLRLRADGKVLKPEGWVGPDVAGVLTAYWGHR